MDEMINEVEIQPEQIGMGDQKWYEKAMSLKDIRTIINANYQNIKRSFIAIGFYLKKSNREKSYLEDGYKSIWEFAYKEYGLSMSTASRYMNINSKFSIDGDSPYLQEKYKDFSRSQLQEMLALNEEQLEQVTPKMAVLDIRDMARPEESEEEQVPGQIDISEFPEFLPVDMAAREQEPAEKGQSFTMSLADMLGGEPAEEEGEPSIAISQQEVEADQTIDAEFEEILEPDRGLKQIGMLNLSCNSENILRRAGIDTVEELASMSDKEFAAVRGMSKRVMEEIRTKLKDLDSKDKVEPEESMTDLQVARKKLERAKNTLNTCLKDVPDEDNIYIRGMKLTVAAWESLVCDMDIENPPPKPEQPELPILKNNDQRAAFVDNFETWPLWIETKETGERYYRYDLEDGTSMVVKVYRAMLFDYSISGLSYEERYSEGYGRHEYYLLQPGKFFKDCEANRSTLIEKLKEIQRRNHGTNKA